MGQHDYEERVRYYTEQELDSHPQYRAMIDMVTQILKLCGVFESFNVEQTGGFTMVPTFYLKDGVSIGMTWDAEHWLMCLYDVDGECIWESGAIPEDGDSQIAERTGLIAGGWRG